MFTSTDKKLIKYLYCEEGYSPEEIADELGLDEIEVMEYCAEIF